VDHQVDRIIHSVDDFSVINGHLGCYHAVELRLVTLYTPSLGMITPVNLFTFALRRSHMDVNSINGLLEQVDAIALWIDSNATTHVCKDCCWFKTYESVEDGSVLYMGDDHFAHVLGKGSVVLEFSLGKSITLFNVLYVPKLCKNLIFGPVLNKCGYKQVYESDKYILPKSGVFVGFGYYNNGMFMLNLNKVHDDSDSVYMSSSTVVNSSLLHARLGHVHYKRMLEMSKDDLILAIDENMEKCTTCMLTKITRQPFKSITRKSVILELIHSDLCDFHATPSLGNKNSLHTTANGVAKRKNRALKEMVNSMLSYSGLSEGFWGEAMLTACYLLNRVPNKRNKTTPYELWYKKRPNLSFLRVWGFRVVVRLSDPKRKTLGEKGIDCIFVGYAKHSKAYRPKDIIPNSVESQKDDHSDDVPSETPKPRKAIDDKIGSIMENNTWLLFDLPSGCKPLGCKWFFKRKMKVDGPIDKFKARLVIQGFRQKKGIDYFDTYAPVARITTIRLLLALAAIHNLVIHQMDVKTTFLNGDLEEVYMKQPKGFVIPRNEHKNILKKFNHKDCSPVSTPMDPVKKLKPNTSKPVDQLEYSRAIGCLMYAMTSTRPYIAYVVGRLKYEFVVLAAAGKEAEWLRNLIHEIPIWPKPIALISIRCDSAATLAKAYSQIYNGKSRHLGVRHSMIRELIRVGMISIEFVRSQHNLADHLTKGLARDLVIKSVIGM
ncbi:zinc finger, CCHC-type containing protein, partial [Tanacetum coccineum]